MVGKQKSSLMHLAAASFESEAVKSYEASSIILSRLAAFMAAAVSG